MKKKYLELFDKAIHDVKFLMQDIANERTEHHRKVDVLMKKHDLKVNKSMKKLKSHLDELYELFLAWSDEGGKSE